MARDEFSVYQFFANDVGYEKVAELVSMQEAIRIGKICTTSVGAKLGTTERVIITDGGDSIVFEWNHQRGVTFPK